MNFIKRFIKTEVNYLIGKIKGFVFTRDFNSKCKVLVELLFNISVTGIIIAYIINYRNFFSYGLASALVMFYIKWLRKLFIVKNVDDVDKL